MSRGDARRAAGTAEPAAAIEPAFEPVPVSFAALYADRFQPMVRLATLLCGRVEVARDVVQDAFVGLHVKWDRVDHPAAYLRRSVVNGCRSRARWERLRRGRASTAVPTTDLQPEELNDVLALLSARQRAAIVLRFYEQRSEAEIADLLGCRPGTVGSLVSRGLAVMRHHLADAAVGGGRTHPETEQPDGS